MVGSLLGRYCGFLVLQTTETDHLYHNGTQKYLLKMRHFPLNTYILNLIRASRHISLDLDPCSKTSFNHNQHYCLMGRAMVTAIFRPAICCHTYEFLKKNKQWDILHWNCKFERFASLLPMRRFTQPLYESIWEMLWPGSAPTTQ